MMPRCMLIASVAALLPAAACFGAERPAILYVTTSAGFRHDSIEVSAQVLQDICERSRSCDVTHTEDTGQITAENLARFRAVLFFTSGELPVSVSQKQALLSFVRAGGSFAGFHSATDTLYNWPEYGRMIGGYFDGHPWTQAARILTVSPQHSIVQRVPSPWTLTEEYYQFRDFVREDTTVLLELDKASVDLTHPEVRASEFPLAWTRNYEAGRVFYTALGHFRETWTDPTFQRLVADAIAWLLSAPPSFGESGIGNAASLNPSGVVSPGSLITIFGAGLTTGGRSQAAAGANYPVSLAGSTVMLAGRWLPLLFAGPTQINAMVPADFEAEICLPVIGGPCVYSRAATLAVSNGAASASRRVYVTPVTPGIFAVIAEQNLITIWATGLGAVSAGADGLSRVRVGVKATVAGIDSSVLFAGLSPEFEGLYQVNVAVPASVSRPSVQRVELAIDGAGTVSAAVILP